MASILVREAGQHEARVGALGALRNVCASHTQNQALVAYANGVGLLLELVDDRESSGCTADAVALLHSLSQCSEAKLALIDAGVVPALVALTRRLAPVDEAGEADGMTGEAEGMTGEAGSPPQSSGRSSHAEACTSTLALDATLALANLVGADESTDMALTHQSQQPRRRTASSDPALASTSNTVAAIIAALDAAARGSWVGERGSFFKRNLGACRWRMPRPCTDAEGCPSMHLIEASLIADLGSGTSRSAVPPSAMRRNKKRDPRCCGCAVLDRGSRSWDRQPRRQ